MTYDDAAVERVARWLARRDNITDDVEQFFLPGCISMARLTWEQDAREIIALLTPPPDPV